MSAQPHDHPIADPLPGLRKQLTDEYGDSVPADVIDLVARQSLGEFQAAKVRTSCRSSHGGARGVVSATPPPERPPGRPVCAPPRGRANLDATTADARCDDMEKTGRPSAAGPRGLADLARAEPRFQRRRLADDRQEGVEDPTRDARAGDRGSAVLRLDRQRDASRRRRSLRARLHAATEGQQLVRAERRAGRADDRGGGDDRGGLGRDRRGQAERALGGVHVEDRRLRERDPRRRDAGAGRPDEDRGAASSAEDGPPPTPTR